MDISKIEQELVEQRAIIEKIYISAEKTRKYFLWTLIVTLILFVLPLLVMAFVLPSLLSGYSELLSGAGLGL